MKIFFYMVIFFYSTQSIFMGPVGSEYIFITFLYIALVTDP